MARLPDVGSLGERPAPQPARGTVGYDVPSGIEAPGRALADLGNTVATIGAQWQEKADTTKIEDAWNQYKNAALDATVGENGAMQKKGGDAVNGNLLQATGQTLGAARQALEATLTNDEQRRRFAERATVTDLQVKSQILGHLATEHQEYAKTTMMGSQSAAQSQIAAMPMSPDVFKQAKDTLLAQSDTFLDSQGIRDPLARDAYKEKVTDSLWKTRIDALLYKQPLLADALFRANQDQIHNPELRLQMQGQTREAALGVNAGIEAQKAIDETRATVLPSQNVGRATPEGGPATGQMTDTGIAVGPGARSTRNNNPGNIEKSSIQWPGQVEGDDSRFVKFATYEDGVAAMQKNLLSYQDKRGINTVEGIIARWAPAKENGQAATANYTKKVADALGVNPGDKIDLHDQATMQTVVQAMTSYEAGGSGSGAQRVAMQNSGALPQNTSGMPNARDVAAQLPVIMGKVEKTADRLYGPDTGNPDRAAFVRRMTGEVHAKLSADVQQLNAIERQAQGQLIDAIAGITPSGGQGAAGAPGAVKTGATGAQAQKITSFGQIQADPQLFRSYQLLDYQGKIAVDNMIEKNLKAEDRGDPVFYREMWNRIHLEPGDPKKIDFYKQIIDPQVANRLSISQIGQLRAELDRDETPGGRSLNQLRKNADKQVEMYFKTNPMFTAQPDRQIAATMQWNEDVGKLVDTYVNQGQPQKVRAMFQLGTPESVVDQKFLAGYINTTPAAGVAGNAAAVKAGTAQPLAQVAPIAQPANIDTREKLDAWFQTLPATQTTFTGVDGVVRKIPPRAAAATAPAPSSQSADAPGKVGTTEQPVIPPVVMNDAGKLVQPQPAPAAPEPDVTADDFKITTKPTTVAGNIAAIRKARERALEIRKFGAQGPQYDILGPVESLGAGMKVAGERAMSVPRAAGAAIAQAIPTEMEAVTAGFEAIKKSRRISPADTDILEQVIRYGQLAPADEKLARGLLAKLEAKK